MNRPAEMLAPSVAGTLAGLARGSIAPGRPWRYVVTGVAVERPRAECLDVLEDAGIVGVTASGAPVVDVAKVEQLLEAHRAAVARWRGGEVVRRAG